jgi:heme-degrading monooxygenase HmoA
MPFVSITRLRVRSWFYMPAFAWFAMRSGLQATKADGNLKSEVLADRRNTYWTATLWASEGDMKKFMLSGAHREAMPKLAHWCDEGAVVYWVQDAGELPTWEEAWSRLLREGRKSKVHRPSAAHLAHDLPAPRVRPSAARRLK